jgi:hypothetical protein
MTANDTKTTIAAVTAIATNGHSKHNNKSIKEAFSKTLELHE